MPEERKKINQIILGIDPGTKVTGYGVLACSGGAMKALDFGCIRPPANRKLSTRYGIIFQGLNTLIEKFIPTVVVVETQFVQKNIQTAIKLGMARGVVIIAAELKGIPIVEYAPSQAKLAVTGKGSASKKQVQFMVQKILELSKLPEPEDAADALALAICHLHASEGKNLIGKEL